MISKNLNSLYETGISHNNIYIDKNKNNDINNKNYICNNYKEEKIEINKEQLKNKEYLIKLIQNGKKEFLEIFEILNYIGSGGESIVYKGKIKNSNKFVTMKFIYENNDNINMNEIGIAKILKNQNIVDFYGFENVVKNKLDVIIMEYAHFGNMKDFKKNVLKRAYFSESLIGYFAVQILKGLYYMHIICKIAHLDLKPENIIIDQYLNAKIIDFSISLNYSQITSKKIRLSCRGTSFYMAPEVLSSKIINVKDLNKVDLFSFGVIIFYLAFGYLPYGLTSEISNDFNKIAEKIEKNELEIKENEFYSNCFNDFLKRLLEKDINKRINIFEAINHDFIKKSNILFEEKEKTYNVGNFLVYLMTDHLKTFNDLVYNSI